jgi:hypothetical protein
MSVIRVEKTKDYTVMSNYHLKEPNMSLKAKGLLSLILSLPDDWNYSIAGLVSICKENETSIKNTLDELKQFGYLEITKVYPNESKSGRIEYVYTIYEKAKQEGKKQDLENLPLEIQPLENQGQLNTKYQVLNNQVLKDNKKEINKENLEDRFEEIWKLYPRKEGKSNAFKKYLKIYKKVSDNEIIKGIDKYVGYIEKNKIENKYIKMGSSWFNGECWNDIYEEEPEGKVEWLSEGSFRL